MQRITSRTPSSAEPFEQRPDPQLLGADPVDGAERTSEHVVRATELPRPLDGDDVPRVLDDADDRRVASRVGADRAELGLCDVEAPLAEPHAVLHLHDRLGEAEGLLRSVSSR